MTETKPISYIYYILENMKGGMDMLLEKAIQGFSDHLESKERSQETVRGYGQALRDFKKYMEKKNNGHVYVDEIDVSDLEGYLSYRKAEGDQPVSRNRSLYILRSFYDYLAKRDIVTKDISQKLEPIKVQRKERTYLEEEETEELIEAIDHPVIKAAVITMSYTGLRVSELCSLTLEDVNLDTGLIKVRQGKGNKDRTVPINDKLLEILKEYKDSCRTEVDTDRFFATAKTGKLSPQSINRCLHQATEKLNWSKQVTAHVLRHSFASRLVKNKVDLPALQRILGHSDLRVTSMYIHQNLDQLKDAVSLM